MKIEGILIAPDGKSERIEVEDSVSAIAGIVGKEITRTPLCDSFLMVSGGEDYAQPINRTAQKIAENFTGRDCSVYGSAVVFAVTGGEFSKLPNDADMLMMMSEMEAAHLGTCVSLASVVSAAKKLTEALEQVEDEFPEKVEEAMDYLADICDDMAEIVETVKMADFMEAED